MPYVENRTVYDADSHVMELDGWLADYADPGIRDALRPLALGGAGPFVREAISSAQARRDDPAATAALEANVMQAKGWSGLGAFDPHERSRALDHLGFAAQLVFSTLAPTQFLGNDLELVFGGARAHN